ncbi:hypothetical protein [Dasania marina]|uniref:hypothetical protein n=1 Tax=Dasania marina TaxID=471499 RepID=UPI0030D882BD|tara:strand:- start:111395 stop:112186 length:792 start_codon:yes stop_codon:yes gene_type:complete
MESLYKIVFLLICLLGFNAAQGSLLGPGDIAFTGWNADSRDAFSFVALTDINAGESIVFTDNEWSGTAFTSGESELSWTASNGLAAGTIVAITDSHSATDVAASSGSVSGRVALNASNEGLFALLGTLAAPSHFLTAFSSDGAAGFGSLSGTGLTVGLNAIDFHGTASQDDDVFAYAGIRAGESSFSDYLGLINDTNHWLSQGGSGSQHNDGIVPDTPFSTIPFVVQPAAVVAEPSSLSLLLLAMIVLVGLRYRSSANHLSIG